MKKRLLASLLSLAMVLTILPTAALAVGDDPDTGEPSEDTLACTCTELCTETKSNSACPVCAENYSVCESTAPEGTEPAPTEEPTDPQQLENTLTEEPTQVELLQTRIDALPTAEELSTMEAEERDAAYVEAISIDDAIWGLPDEEQALLETVKLDAVFEWFNAQIATQPEYGNAEGTELGPWDVSANEDNSVTASLTANGDSTYTLTISGTGAMEDFDNPTSTEEGAVKAPWYAALSPVDGDLVPITGIVIGDGITYVGSYAFAYTSVTMAAFNVNIADYGSGIYYGCTDLTTVDWTNFKPTNVNDDFVTSRTETGPFVPFSLFDQCEELDTCKIGDTTYTEGTLVLPDNITGICTAAFRGTGFSNVDFSDGLKEIEFVGPYGLAFLSNLKSVTIPNDVEFYSTDEGKGGARTFTGGALETVTIQSPGTTIAVEMFYNCDDLETVNTADNIKKIEQSGFSGCGLTSFSSDSVEEIGQYAFLNNTGLASLKLGAVEIIAGGAFAGCSSLKTVDIEGSTTLSIPNTAFGTSGSSTDNAAPIESFTLENGTPPTFTPKAKSTLKTLMLGDGVNWEIPVSYCQNATQLESVTLGNGITGIGNYAFYKCSNLATVNLPEDGQLATIGVSAFSSDYVYSSATDKGKSDSPKIQTIDIPASVTSIGDRAFMACMSLETVRIAPNSKLTNIGVSAFINCFGLETVDLSGISSSAAIGRYSFGSSSGTRNQNCIFYVSDATVNNALTITNISVNAYSKNIVAITVGGIFAPNTDFTNSPLATPVKDGYKFDGWYKDERCDTKADNSDPNAGQTYYAKWTDVSDYNIAEDAANQTLSMTYGDAPVSKTVTVKVPPVDGSISKVESSTDAINAQVEGSTVTITAADGLDTGIYTGTVYVYAADNSTHWINVTLTVYKAGSTVNPDEDSVYITATYGDTITLTAEVAKAQTNGISLMAAQDEVEFFCGSTSLGAARVRYSDGSHTSGVATLIYDTSDGGIPVGTTSTITAVYGGSVNLNGSNTNSIQVTLNKINTSIDIAPDRTSLTGGGTMTLTVDKSGLPAGADVKVTCNNGVTPTENTDGTWAATLPNATATYTFSATYEGNAYYSGATDTCTVSVTRRSNGGGGSGGSTTYTVSTDAGRNGDVTVSPSRASYGDTVTITVDPDEGYELDELIVTDSDGDEISVRSRGDGRYTFTMPRGRVTVEATFVEITEDPDLLTFTDVPASAYYYDAVYWAVENGVTNGTSATTFSPNASCTRAQMVTFLWRAAGSPEPESTVNPFTDVSASAYYYDAVLWAVEQGITNGTSATTFGPDATVTRGQTVTFLWRYDGSPAVSGSGFDDVVSDAYYADAVAWAAGEGVTSGTSATTFSPSNDCTRGQIVTFLYRYMG